MLTIWANSFKTASGAVTGATAAIREDELLKPRLSAPVKPAAAPAKAAGARH